MPTRRVVTFTGCGDAEPSGNGAKPTSSTTEPSARPTTPPTPVLRSSAFVTPSGNISCTEGSILTCAIGSGLSPAPDALCEIPNGWIAMHLSGLGGATPVCTTPMANDPSAQTLEYGQRWRGDGIGCRVVPAGLTCTNGLGNGFFLSRTEWHVISFTHGPVARGVAFRMPSGNIGCALFGEGNLRCDILSGLDPEPSTPCPVDWVGVHITTDGETGPECAGDSVYMEDAPVLAWGREWRGPGITCDSDHSGLYCWHASGHGFMLSRARWVTY